MNDTSTTFASLTSTTAMFVSPTTMTNTTLTFARNSGNATAPLDIFALVCMFLLFVIGVCGNLFTIAILRFVKKGPATAYDLMLISLSVSDLVCVIVVPAMFAYGTLTNFQRWDFGMVGCKVLLSVLPINVTISQCILMLMSVDRYRVISKPFARNGITKSRTIVCVISFVFLGTLLAGPKFHALELHSVEGSSKQMCNPVGHKNLYTLSYAFTMFIRDIVSTTIIGITGRKIGTALVTNSNNLAKHGYMGTKMASRLDHVNSTRRMLRLMLVVFSVCTIPLDAFQLCFYIALQVDGASVNAQVFAWLRSVNTVLYLFQTSNAAVNVFIYGARHRDFRPVLERIGAARRSLFHAIFSCASDGNLTQSRQRGNIFVHVSRQQTVRGMQMVALNNDVVSQRASSR
ncbi:urotensin-2 receptor-like [Rhopilema esculentum]|uniref:urotensin-2 receptor-like n=1 Tax=Rhopilema esculentum TaxID=499914 RepID=UPI0031E07454|eukprot:gene9522-17263_t